MCDTSISKDEFGDRALTKTFGYCMRIFRFRN